MLSENLKEANDFVAYGLASQHDCVSLLKQIFPVLYWEKENINGIEIVLVLGHSQSKTGYSLFEAIMLARMASAGMEFGIFDLFNERNLIVTNEGLILND